MPFDYFLNSLILQYVENNENLFHLLVNLLFVVLRQVCVLTNTGIHINSISCDFLQKRVVPE